MNVYEELTDGLRRPLRVAELVYAAPGLPSRAEIDEERTHLQKDKVGLEIAQGDFVADVLAPTRRRGG
jgi:thioesterase DpgC